MGEASPPDGGLETRTLDSLREHPDQSRLFAPATHAEIAELAKNIGQCGLQYPPEVLSDGTILTGHKRVAAMKSLGWTESLVRVRHDLADAEDARRRLIEDNLLRQQLSPLTVARCYGELLQIERNGPSALNQPTHGDMRDRVGKKLGYTGRHLDRLLRISEHTPIEVQNAVDRGELVMLLAEKIAALPLAAKGQIAAAIRAGQPPKKVALKAIKKPPKASAGDLLVRFVRGIERSKTELDGREQEIAYISESDVEKLKDFRSILDMLIKKQSASRKADRQSASKLKNLVRNFT